MSQTHSFICAPKHVSIHSSSESPIVTQTCASAIESKNYLEADHLFETAKSELAALDRLLIEDLHERHRIIMRGLFVSTIAACALMALFFKVMP